MHGAGIVHRDVKPENVMVQHGGGLLTAKVADFGVAKVAAGAVITRMTSLIGTPEYLAPEIIAGAEASPAVDVYAAGVVVYELLFGRTPFAGGSIDDVLEGHRSRPPRRPDGVPEVLWSALEQLMAKEPQGRPTAAGPPLYWPVPLLRCRAWIPSLPRPPTRRRLRREAPSSGPARAIHRCRHRRPRRSRGAAFRGGSWPRAPAV